MLRDIAVLGHNNYEGVRHTVNYRLILNRRSCIDYMAT